MRAPALVAVAAFSMLAGNRVSAQLLDPAETSSVLAAYARCQFTGRLAASSIDRAPDLPMARPVETASGTKRVSVADGYRLMLAFPDLDPFVNLKIERSIDGRYASDKQTVLDQMQHMATNSHGTVVKLERHVERGIDIAALNNPSLAGSIISFYSLFNDKKGVILTAHILNQLPERRSFQNMEQYRVQRDRLVGDLVSCLASVGQAK